MRFAPRDLPPELGVSVVDRLAGEVRRLTEQQAEKHERAVEASAALEQARLADIEARAVAVRSGKPTKADTSEKALADLREAERDEATYEEAVRHAERDLSAALAKHHGQLRSQALERTEAARAEIGRLLSDLETTQAELAQAQALISWLDGVKAGGVEDRRGDWHKSPGYRPESFAGRLPLPGPNGDPLTVPAAVAALRALAKPPEPKPSTAPVRPLRQAV